MLITFKSRATADVIMYEMHAQPILDILQKDIKRGVITAAESTHAISLIEQKIKESRAIEAAESKTNSSTEYDDHEQKKIEPVTFSARAYPLLDMLREASKKNVDIVWGV